MQATKSCVYQTFCQFTINFIEVKNRERIKFTACIFNYSVLAIF